MSKHNRTICFYNETPLWKRDQDRFGFDVFLNKGFEVKYLDMTRLLNPGYLSGYAPKHLSSHPGIARVSTWEQVGRFVEQHRDAFAIPLVAFQKLTAPLYELFATNGVDYAQYGSAPLPSWDLHAASLSTRISRKLRNQYLNPLLKVSTRHFRRFLDGNTVATLGSAFEDNREIYSASRYCLRTGQRSICKCPRHDGRTKELYLHWLDYDLYLEHRDCANQPTTPYAVFLDEYFPFHPDYLTASENELELDAINYYEGLHRFFRKIEITTGMPVVIAAHPRARYDEHPDFFRGRDVKQFQTAELVAHCNLVLEQESRSINFPVMFRKPIVFLTSNDLLNTRYGPLIENFARYFGKNTFNVDVDNFTKDDLDRESVVEESRYARYIHDYIKVSGSTDLPYWESVLKELDRDQIGGKTYARV